MIIFSHRRYSQAIEISELNPEILKLQRTSGRETVIFIYAPGGTWEEFLKYDPVHDSEKSRNSIRSCATKGVPFGSDAYLRKLENERGLSLMRNYPRKDT